MYRVFVTLHQEALAAVRDIDGEAALEFAGGMKQQGSYYLLLPKPLAARLALTG